MRLQQFKDTLVSAKPIMLDNLQKKLLLGQYNEYSSSTDDLEQLFKESAPGFPNQTGEILSIVPVYPLMFNIFGSIFCMGCSALFHLIKDRSADF